MSEPVRNPADFTVVTQAEARVLRLYRRSVAAMGDDLDGTDTLWYAQCVPRDIVDACGGRDAFLVEYEDQIHHALMSTVDALLDGRRTAPDAQGDMTCRVYWGSHGCDRPRGHRGPHICDSCWDPTDTEGYVGAPPYYGPDTVFYGEDAPSPLQP